MYASLILIPFSDCCHSEPHCYLTGFTVHCLHMFGAVLSGGKVNIDLGGCMNLRTNP